MGVGAALAILISGKDTSAPAFASAAGNADKLKGTLANVNSAMGGMAATAAKMAGGAALAVGGGLAAIGAAGLQMASDNDAAFSKLQGQLGVTGEEAQRLGGIANEVFRSNWGESVPAVTEAIGTIRRNLGDLGDDVTKSATESALAIEQLFGASANESSRTVAVMMKNFDGLDPSKAFDLITTGFQRGGDMSEELLDSLREYAPQFAKLGLSAEESMGLLLAGLDAGAWNLDKVGDAVKEFAIRAIDGSKLTAEGFTLAGLDAAKMSATIAKGGPAAAAAFQETLKAIVSIEDPLKREAAGVALLGTQWEDLGPKVIEAMANGATAVEGFEGATKRAGDAASKNLPASIETLKRTALGLATDAIAPLVPKLTEMALTMSEKLPGAFDAVKGAIGGFIDEVAILLGLDPGAFATPFEALPAIFATIGENLEPVMSALGTMVSLVGEHIQPILAALGAAILAVVVPAFIAWATAAATAAAATVIALAPVVLPILAIAAAAALLTAAWTSNWGDIQGKTAAVWSVIEPILAGIFATLSRFWTEIQPLLEAAWIGIQNAITVAMGVVQAAIDTGLAVISGIWSSNWETIQTVFDTVWAAIELAVGIAWTAVETVIKTGLKLLAGDWEGAWEEMRTGLSTIWERIQGAAKTAWDTLSSTIMDVLNGLVTDATNAGAGMVKAFADGITEKLDTALGAAREMAQKLRDLLPHSDAKEGPLSDLTSAGRALPATFAKGIADAGGMPTVALSSSLTSVRAGLEPGGNRRGNGGGSTYHISVTGVGLDEVATEIDRRMRRRQLVDRLAGV